MGRGTYPVRPVSCTARQPVSSRPVPRLSAGWEERKKGKKLVPVTSITGPDTTVALVGFSGACTQLRLRLSFLLSGCCRRTSIDMGHEHRSCCRRLPWSLARLHTVPRLWALSTALSSIPSLCHSRDNWSLSDWRRSMPAPNFGSKRDFTSILATCQSP